MTDDAQIMSRVALPEEGGSRSALSPQRLADIVGQTDTVRRLAALVELSKGRGQPLPHILLIGRAGMGKSTLAIALANEMGAAIVTTVGPSLDRGIDLMGILTNLGERDVLFIDEIHRLPRVVEELLYPAMEDFSVDFVMDKGLNARTMRIPLRPFTCIATTDMESAIRPRLRALFPVVVTLRSYSEVEIAALAVRVATARGLSLTPDAAALIAASSTGSIRRMTAVVHLLTPQRASVNISAAEVAKVLGILGHPAGAVQGRSGMAPDLMGLSGQEFEVLITSLLQRFGFQTELTKVTGDGGIDIVASLDRPLVGGRYLVQCKRFAPDAPVGASMVREFYGAFVAARGAIKGLFITTSTFSPQAREFAEHLPLELIDGEQLQRLRRGSHWHREESSDSIG